MHKNTFKFKPLWNETSQFSAESFRRFQSRASSPFYNQVFVCSQDTFKPHDYLPQQPLVQHKVKTNHCILKDTDPCSRNPCTNGGACLSDSGSFRCLCRPGYTGRLCYDGKALSSTLRISSRNPKPDFVRVANQYIYNVLRNLNDMDDGPQKAKLFMSEKKFHPRFFKLSQNFCSLLSSIYIYLWRTANHLQKKSS